MVDYLKYCREAAENKGYKWIMVLLARELDAVRSYDQLKKYWNSFNDLTGDLVLFITSISNDSNEKTNGLQHEFQSWRMINNLNLMIVNEESPSISAYDFPSEKTIEYYRNLAIENNSNGISNLCRYFNIPEESVPSILLFETCSGSLQPSCIIPLESDDLYASIKKLFIFIQLDVEKYRNLLEEIAQIKNEIAYFSGENGKNDLSDIEKQYIRTKNSLMNAVESNGIDKVVVQNTIIERNEELCLSFPRPINYQLSRLIKLISDTPDIEDSITKKQHGNDHYETLIKSKREILNKKETEMKKAEGELFSKVKQYGEQLSTEKDFIRPQLDFPKWHEHFKIGFTFSGKYREKIVEPLCRELLKWGYDRNDIFYDAWHDVLINGVHGDTTLREIYTKKCDFVVVLLSPDYKERNWTGNIEWPAIKELINTNKSDKICLLRINKTDIGSIDGLYINQTIFKDIDNLSIKEIAVFINNIYYYRTHNPNQ